MMNEWISVKEKLPTEDQIVIAFAKIKPGERNYQRKSVMPAIFSACGFDLELKFRDLYILGGDYDYKSEIPGVTHWMPLPEGPR